MLFKRVMMSDINAIMSSNKRQKIVMIIVDIFIFLTRRKLFAIAIGARCVACLSQMHA